LFIDTETGGLDPDKHSLLSLAMVIWGEWIVDSQEILINDGILSVTKALAVNRIDHKINVSIHPSKLAHYYQRTFPGKEKLL
jgi:hypothetical protein